MRAYNNVNRTSSQTCDGFIDLLFGAESREHTCFNRETLKALENSLIMLERKNGCGHKNCALFAVCNTFENGSERNLRFAETDVTAKQPVHRIRFFHILFDFVNAAKLVIGLNVFKPAFKIALHINIFRECVTLHFDALGIKLDKLLCHILNGTLDS